MSTSIMSSFFFLHLVNNYDYFGKRFAKMPLSSVFETKKDDVMSSFSVLYTIMETQAMGLPISERDLETSVALVTAFSWLFCNGNQDPYLVTEIMWEAYIGGDLAWDQGFYKDLHILSSHILKENAKHVSKSKQRQVG